MTTPAAIRRALVASLAVGAALAGCGGGSGPDAQFRHDYLAIRPELNRIVADIDVLVRDTDRLGHTAAAARSMALADRIAAALKRLVPIPHPASMSRPFGQIVGGLGRVEGDLRAFGIAMRNGQAAVASEDTGALVDELGALEAPAAKLRAYLGIAK